MMREMLEELRGQDDDDVAACRAVVTNLIEVLVDEYAAVTAENEALRDRVARLERVARAQHAAASALIDAGPS